MIVELLALFIIISIILFVLCIYTMDENPTLAIPLVMVNMIIIVLITYGFWNVEWLYINPSGNPVLYSTDTYGEVYSYIFLVFFYIHCLLFVRIGFNLWTEALKTKGEMDYRNRFKNRNRR